MNQMVTRDREHYFLFTNILEQTLVTLCSVYVFYDVAVTKETLYICPIFSSFSTFHEIILKRQRQLTTSPISVNYLFAASEIDFSLLINTLVIYKHKAKGWVYHLRVSGIGIKDLVLRGMTLTDSSCSSGKSFSRFAQWNSPSPSGIRRKQRKNSQLMVSRLLRD